MRFTVEVTGPTPVAAAYAYLADPRTRPEWQSSLKAVEDVRGSGEVGTTWTDVMGIGARPRMEITRAEPDRAWAETGRWRSFRMDLLLTFVPATVDGAEGTRLVAEVDLALPTALRPFGPLLKVAAPPAIGADLRKALRLAVAPA